MDLASIDHLLTTTRSVRKRLDTTREVDMSVVRECINLAIQAPDGGNLGKYHFLVITDAEKRATIAGYYKKSFDAYLATQKDSYAGRIYDSASHLAENLKDVPVYILTCTEGRVDTLGAMSQAARYGSILPATWSLMLALRSRGIGAAWTTLHLACEKEIAELLDIPHDVTQGALLPVAYYTGEDFKPGKRIPAEQRTYYDGWGATR
jgi:nitroreductase